MPHSTGSGKLKTCVSADRVASACSSRTASFTQARSRPLWWSTIRVVGVTVFCSFCVVAMGRDYPRTRRGDRSRDEIPVRTPGSVLFLGVGPGRQGQFRSLHFTGSGGTGATVGTEDGEAGAGS